MKSLVKGERRRFHVTISESRDYPRNPLCQPTRLYHRISGSIPCFLFFKEICLLSNQTPTCSYPFLPCSHMDAAILPLPPAFTAIQNSNLIIIHNRRKRHSHEHLDNLHRKLISPTTIPLAIIAISPLSSAINILVVSSITICSYH